MAKSPSEYSFTLQWHVTAKCQQYCRHCYMHDEPSYESEIKNELSYDDCVRVMKDFKCFTDFMGVSGRINFSGGDPLLRDDIYSLINKARKMGMKVGIIGNPALINKERTLLLKNSGVESYQISIDGMEETHDMLRAKGSFRDSLRALDMLNQGGIETCVMLTLSKKNMLEVGKVMELVGKHNVFSFSFARLSPVGTGKQFQNDQITPSEYRNFLVAIERKIDELKNMGTMTRFGRKCHLWKLLEYEKGHIDLPDDKETIFDGCTIGVTGLILLADGTVYACRRFPSPIGKVPEQKLADVFLYSKELNNYRDYRRLEKCSKCELVQICRGCPAVAYGAHGDWMKPDPQCWKIIK